jgi:hypothetical protein
VAAAGPAAEVLGDGLDEFGVAPPARVRLQRAARKAGLPPDVIGRLAEATAW